MAMTIMLTTDTTTASAMDMMQFGLFNFTENYTNTCVLQAPCKVAFMLCGFPLYHQVSGYTVAAAQHAINLHCIINRVLYYLCLGAHALAVDSCVCVPMCESVCLSL